MAIYDNLPYTNFHELNADWLLKQMKEAKAKIDEYQEVLDQFEEDYTVLLGLASAMTVAGSNVTVAGTLTANGLIGNLTGNVTGDVTGDLTGNVTGNVTGDVTGDLTGNVTGNVTGDVTGNADTATTADGLSGTASINTTGTIEASAFTGNLTGNVTGNLTGNVTGNLTGTATLTSNFTLRTDITTADADDYMPTVDGMAVFKTGELSSHIMSSLSGEYFIIIAVKEGSHGWQIAYCPYGSSDIFFRTKFSSWTNWMKVTATTAS